MDNETVDKGWLSGVYWKCKYDALMVQYQQLIHQYEELKGEADTGHRNEPSAQQDMVRGNEEA